MNTSNLKTVPTDSVRLNAGPVWTGVEVTHIDVPINTFRQAQAEDITALVISMRSLSNASFLFDTEEVARKRATLIGNVGTASVSSDGI